MPGIETHRHRTPRADTPHAAGGALDVSGKDVAARP